MGIVESLVVFAVGLLTHPVAMAELGRDGRSAKKGDEWSGILSLLSEYLLSLYLCGELPWYALGPMWTCFATT